MIVGMNNCRIFKKGHEERGKWKAIGDNEGLKR